MKLLAVTWWGFIIVIAVGLSIMMSIVVAGTEPPPDQLIAMLWDYYWLVLFFVWLALATLGSLGWIIVGFLLWIFAG